MTEAESWAVEAELWAAYANTPDDPAVVGRLVGALTARGAAILPDLEERSIVLQRRDLPEDPGLVIAHVAVLLKQGKPVPPDLEALSLQQILAGDPNNAGAIQALVALHRRTGQQISPELERKSLSVALAERPGDLELLRAMAAVEAKLQPPAPAIVVRSEPTEAPPAPGLEEALNKALQVRPADTYLLSLLLSLLLETGRITRATGLQTVLAQLPPYVQTSEAVIVALLQAAAKNRAAG